MFRRFVQQILFHRGGKDYYSEKIAEAKEYNETLIATKDNLDSKEYIETICREKLNMYYPNERIYVDNSK